MNEEEQAIIEEIEGKLSDRPIVNYVLADEYMKRYISKKEVVAYLNSVIEEKASEDKLSFEALIDLVKAIGVLNRGQFQEAYSILEPYTHHPDFFFKIGQCLYETCNAAERALFYADRPEAKRIEDGIRFGSISHLFGCALNGMGEYAEALRYLANASCWDPYRCEIDLERLDVLTSCLFSKGNPPKKEDLEELENDFRELQDKVFLITDLSEYIRKLGRLLEKEGRLEQARACFLFSIAIWEALKRDDRQSKEAVARIDRLLGNVDHLKGKELITYLKENDLPFQISHRMITFLADLYSYGELDQYDKTLVEMTLSVFDSVIREPYYLFLRVRLPGQEKTCECFSTYEGVEAGGIVLMSYEGKSVPGEVIGKRYLSYTEVKESDIQCEEVEEVLLRTDKCLDAQYYKRFGKECPRTIDGEPRIDLIKKAFMNQGNMDLEDGSRTPKDSDA